MTLRARLRSFRPEDAAFIRSLVAVQGWNAGVHDVETFTAVDPEAWIVAEIDRFAWRLPLFGVLEPLDAVEHQVE